jgi:Transposase IS116/IS110/IS902 family
MKPIHESGRQHRRVTQSSPATARRAKVRVKPSPRLPDAPQSGRRLRDDAHKLTATARRAKKPVKPKAFLPDASQSGRQSAFDAQESYATARPANDGMKPNLPLPGATSNIVESIRSHHRARRFAMGIQQVLDRKLESYVRINKTDWQADADEASREKANADVKLKIKQARDGKSNDAFLLGMVAVTDKAREPADKERMFHEKQMESLAGQLSVAEWVKSIPGFGLLGLATIVAETGDLAKYPNPAKVWKRLGFAPYEGHAGSTWKREKWRPRSLSKDEWIDNPFAGPRYSFIYVIAVWLKNKQWIGAAKTDDGVGKANGIYGEIYAKRREHTALTHPDWTKAHSHQDALRIMMKAVLKDLWIRWNQKS